MLGWPLSLEAQLKIDEAYFLMMQKLYFLLSFLRRLDEKLRHSKTGKNQDVWHKADLWCGFRLFFGRSIFSGYLISRMTGSPYQCCGSGSIPGLDPDLMGSLDPYPDPDLQSASGSRRTNMTHKHRKKFTGWGTDRCFLKVKTTASHSQ